jgi:3-deoxy-D-arabino-heptulosonate 7-phosphate (DAHP) synthase
METYAIYVARLLRMDLTNMGFAGTTHLDDAMDAYIADDLAWGIVSRELRINVIDL